MNQPMPPPGPWNTGPVPPATPPAAPPPAAPPPGYGGPPTVAQPPVGPPTGAGTPTGGPGTPGGPGDAGGSGGSGASGGGKGALIAVVAVLATLVVVGIIVGAFWLGRRGSADDSTTATASTAGPTTTPTTTTTAAPTTAAPATVATTILGDVRTQPAGLFCRDLRAKGFSYPAAVDYWRVQGQPERLDADRDGIPCETVYPTGDVIAYWGTQGVTPTIESRSVYDLPAGLLCRQLADRGFSVYEAIDYYLNWGGPRNMDVDGNGVPCETVYPDASSAWFGGTGD